MLARTASPLTFVQTVPGAALADRLPDPATVVSRAATADQRPGAVAGGSAVLPGLKDPGTRVSPCPPRSSMEIVCANADGCICPLSDHVTNAERAIMNDIARQASQLATVLAVLFAAVAITAMIMLVVR